MEIDNKVLYKIYVTTSNFQTAGTTSNVYIQLYGKENKRSVSRDRNRSSSKSNDVRMFKFPLERSKNHEKNFRPGQTDIFEIEETYIGSLKKIRISHDGKKVNSGWHLKKVIIKIPQYNKRYAFICNKWLDYLETKAECDLVPLKRSDNIELSSGEESSESKQDRKEKKPAKHRDRDRDEKKAKYLIKIKTSEFSKSTSPVINLKIVNGETSTNLIKLNHSLSDNKKEQFHSGNDDIFRVEEADVGTIEKIQFFCDNNEEGNTIDWFFDQIEIDMSDKMLRYIFDKRSRSLINKNKKDTMMEIYPIYVKKLSDKKVYSVNMYTNRLKNKAEVSKHLSIIFFGDFGNSGIVKPIKCNNITHNPRESYDPNHDLIHFHLKKLDLGSIYKLKVIYNHKIKSKESKSNWYLKSIEIDYHKEKYAFQHNQWIATSKNDNKKFKIKLFEEKFNPKRTISTLSHRLLEESINQDSYDESLDEAKSDRSRPSSGRRSSSQNESREREKRFSSDESNRHRGKDEPRKRYVDGFSDEADSPRRTRKSPNLEEKFAKRYNLKQYDDDYGNDKDDQRMIKKSPNLEEKFAKKYNIKSYNDEFENDKSDQRIIKKSPSLEEKFAKRYNIKPYDDDFESDKDQYKSKRDSYRDKSQEPEYRFKKNQEFENEPKGSSSKFKDDKYKYKTQDPRVDREFDDRKLKKNDLRYEQERIEEFGRKSREYEYEPKYNRKDSPRIKNREPILDEFEHKGYKPKGYASERDNFNNQSYEKSIERKLDEKFNKTDYDSRFRRNSFSSDKKVDPYQNSKMSLRFDQDLANLSGSLSTLSSNRSMSPKSPKSPKKYDDFNYKSTFSDRDKLNRLESSFDRTPIKKSNTYDEILNKYSNLSSSKKYDYMDLESTIKPNKTLNKEKTTLGSLSLDKDFNKYPKYESSLNSNRSSTPRSPGRLEENKKISNFDDRPIRPAKLQDEFDIKKTNLFAPSLSAKLKQQTNFSARDDTRRFDDYKEKSFGNQETKGLAGLIMKPPRLSGLGNKENSADPFRPSKNLNF